MDIAVADTASVISRGHADDLDDRDQRRELADAISDRDAADRAAAAAKAIADRAKLIMAEAKAAVDRLKANLEDHRRAATRRRAQVVTEALRLGRDLPATPLPLLLSTPRLSRLP